VKLIAALSGGVDSAVAAARLVDQGHQVVGVHLALLPAVEGESTRRGGCCSAADARDAARVADSLGIDFYVWDFAELFAREVIEPFLSEYAAGRTPNPCVRCNERVKFEALLDRALELGFDGLATGHYAEVVHHPDGTASLSRAADDRKDQSYVLAGLTTEQLPRVFLPLGADNKTRVRADAGRRGFRVAGKVDSTDVCFIPDGDTAAWLSDRLAVTPGPIVDVPTGRVLGRHRGAEVFTIGQRRGLGLTTAPADGGRRYVVGTDPRTGVVRVGPAALLEVDRIELHDVNWHRPVTLPDSVGVQYRAHGVEQEALIEHLEGCADRPHRVRVSFARPARGVAPGQALVMYEGRTVLAAGTVTGGSDGGPGEPGR